MQLNVPSLRVLGALMEKEMTTPDTYPLSVNSLIAAANQRSSRDPVMDMTEDEVRTALHQLQDLELVSPARDTGRVPRYEHRIRTVLNLRRDETAVICLLLLRGPQTPGELRSRSDRMHQFDELASVQATLDRLAAREMPLTVVLPRAPGSREARWAHLLGDPCAHPVPAVHSPAEHGSLEDRVRLLEERLALLEARLGHSVSSSPSEIMTTSSPPTGTPSHPHSPQPTASD
jgi:uncharacterized protein